MNRVATALQLGRAFGAKAGMLRLSYEFQRGAGLMSRRMKSVNGWEHWQLPHIAPHTTPEDFLQSRREGHSPFFFKDARSLSASLKQTLAWDDERRLLAQANAVLRGELPFFGRLSYPCHFPPDWFRNAATGQRVSPEQSWTRMRFYSPNHGDLKFILEPSRFLFVYPLVRAYAVTGDDSFAEAFWKLVEDWAKPNPPMSGPLWICGQECSLRILGWTFGLYSFLNSPATTPARASLLLSMIAAHAWRTAQSLSYARSQRSNHLITETVGLWTVGVLYPELRQAKLWQRMGAGFLSEAVLDQINSEGVSQQHSFNYQRMILQLLLWTLQLDNVNEVEIDPRIRERTVNAFDFVSSVVDHTSGHAPNYGSNDGSLILPLSSCEYEDFRPLVQLAAAVLDRTRLPSGPWDEAPLWFGVLPSSIRRLPGTSTHWERPSAESGYYLLGDHTSWALIRAGRYSRRPFQADQLHVDLWWRGLNLACDAGTYLYNGEPPWDNGFARTLVHNTVTVDGCDQMRRTGRFLWLDWAQSSGEYTRGTRGREPECFIGQHDGYKRLGVTHRREVRWLRDAGWIVIDDLIGLGQHELRLHWLTPDLPFEALPVPFQVRFTTSDRQCVGWSIFSSIPGEHAIVRAGRCSTPNAVGSELPLLGWVSPTYGELRPAVSLLLHTRGPLPIRFVTVVLRNPECRVERDANEVLVCCGGTEVERLSLLPRETDRFDSHSRNGRQ